MHDRLFVYGTLRPGCGHPMADFLAAHATHLGQAITAGRLYDLGRYPGMLEPAVDGDWVVGDLFEVTTPAVLQKLDDYEGIESPRPAFFERQVVMVQMPDGNDCRAFVYWYRGDIPEAQRIASGCYLTHLSNNR